MNDDRFFLGQACALWNSGDRELFVLTEVLPGEGVLWKNREAGLLPVDLVGIVDIDAQGHLTPAEEQTSFCTTTTSPY
jgi:hypothetical protein